MRRRAFVKHAGLGGATLLSIAAMSPPPVSTTSSSTAAPDPLPPDPALHREGPGSGPGLDLSPAQWIWYPSARCLPNTFVCFRREIILEELPRRATGWVFADSRYLLTVNGARVQWGPAPSDPRWPEVDPLDLTALLQKGTNVIALLVLFYGQGDGTWATGKPGLLFRLALEHPSGRTETVVSDTRWLTHLARSWQPGHYKRWYLRALQEEFDARLLPLAWTSAAFTPGSDWLPAMPLPGAAAHLPAICSSYPEYAFDLRGDAAVCSLRPRTVPFMRETLVPASRFVEASVVTWLRPPTEYFECLPPAAYRMEPLALRPAADGALTATLGGSRGLALTFEFAEELVGWPFFTIEAPAGTVVELMVQEAHVPGSGQLLNTHFHAWSRFTCRAGVNRFETFDYEACKWLQLHVHGVAGEVRISDVGVRRRTYPWPHAPQVSCSDPSIQRLAEASLNTLTNSAQEIAVDGMGRERQQYSGDGGHQMHALYYSFGETRLPARYITTFSQGITRDGFFLDCWPAYDRLARLWERQIQLSYWGPLLDHGVGFISDCWHHYLYTGDREAVREAYPRLLRFFRYLTTLRRKSDGLLPVEGIGAPSVYIDHLAYTEQKHKECAFNLYTAVILRHFLAPLCTLFGDADWCNAAQQAADELHDAAVARFWDPERRLFVVNRPWRNEETGPRMCDRSLALGILYDLCPDHQHAESVRLLAACPPELGLSYPANACWRLWALGAAGRADLILADLRTRWMAMRSVRENNTLQEFWQEQPDGGSVMSHCGVVPLYILFMTIAGIRPTAPGFARCSIRPQLADLSHLALTAYTGKGPITFTSQGPHGARMLTVTLPPGCDGELLVDPREQLPLKRLPAGTGFALPSGASTVRLQFT